MAILEKEVWVVLGNNIKHYEDLGYDIPRSKDKKGRMKTPKGTEIWVKIEHLPKGSSSAKVTKICDDCGKHIPDQPFSVIMTSRKKNDGKDRCFKCGTVYAGMIRKKNMPYENSLEYYAQNRGKEYLLSEFSPNNTKTPKEISYGTDEKCLWICPNYQHEYAMRVADRTTDKNTNCPYCSGHRTLKDFNDLWTTHSQIAKLLKNNSRGYEVTAHSDKKEIFLCNNCDFEKTMQIKAVTRRGFSCPRCSDGLSYPEKFVFEFITQLNVDFEFQKTFNWSKNVLHTNSKLNGTKIYDFYFPSWIMIVETHGEQHSNVRGFSEIGGKTGEEERENDALKKNLAKENNIKIFVSLDCEKSELEYIKNSILSSRLATIFNLDQIDWLKCHEVACNSFIKKACDYWVDNNNITEISKIMKLSRYTIIKYLKQGKLLNWCNYEALIKQDWNPKEIIRLTLDGIFIDCWSSMNQISNSLNIPIGHIPAVCKGKRQSASGYKWMYKEDYEKTLLGS
ncbi:zinc-ribbon domain-containing protein [Bacillus sp. UNCCL81]|uniref:zinc-ribbon domain-containing protein n=1 Tax=Bacillus sp. UNCCL81 TaxID=1502755 RepID=UPI0008EAEC6A|nr:zinc-ribbon domain-containing protein [Bacillus sp. UNCCL81]SFC52235.1 Probable Zinc-ribbon domain-containing protein [Bacillus sp. UNCCL81]